MDQEVRAPRRTPRLRLRPIHPNGWWLDALMIAGFAAVTAALLLEPVRQFDLAIRDLADSNRPAGADVAAQLVNRLGSGGILSGTVLVLALLLAWLRRSPWPVAPVLGAFLLTSIVIQPLKLIFHREMGLTLRSWVIWYYTFGVHCTRKFSRAGGDSHDT